MNRQIFFSVIIPTFNRYSFLRIALDSVLEQTYRDFEVIIIDDGSTDNTSELVSSYNDQRIRYFHQENHGVSSARNKGLSIATGDFIAFLDSDDHWKKEKLQKAEKYIRSFPDTGIFHTEEIWYRHGKLLKQLKKHQKPSGCVYTSALPICCISISTAIIRKDIFDSIGTFDETLEACEDYDFWLRATHKYEVKLIPEKLTVKDGGRDDQLSQSVWGLDRFRIRSLKKMLLSGTLNDTDLKNTVKELQKKCGIIAAGCRKRGKTEEAEYYSALSEQFNCWITLLI